MSGNVSVLNVTLNFVVMDLNPMITSAPNQLKRESESTYVFLSFHCSRVCFVKVSLLSLDVLSPVC